MRLAVVVLAFAAAGGMLVVTPRAPARAVCHPTMTTTLLRANLDRDRAREEITGTNVSCAHEYAYGIADQCGHHRQHHRLAGTGFQAIRKIVEANGIRDGREFFYVLRRPVARAPDLGTAALTHLSRLSPSRCPTPRHLFVYRAEEPLLPPPPGWELAGFDVQLVELSARYRGTEIRLAETFTREGRVRRRVTLLRYSPAADRYVVYTPKL